MTNATEKHTPITRELLRSLKECQARLKAQERLLAAYRLGGNRPPASALDVLYKTRGAEERARSAIARATNSEATP